MAPTEFAKVNPPAQHGVYDDPQTPNIAGLIVAFLLENLQIIHKAHFIFKILVNYS